MNMEQSSSKIDVQIIVQGKGEINGEIFRHLAPMTINSIIKKMPIYGRVTRLNENMINILAQLSSGAEKSRTKFSKGEIAVLPLNGSICIFLKDTLSTPRMSLIGNVTSNLEILNKIVSGDTIVIKSKMII